MYKRFLMQRITYYKGQWYCYLCESMLQSLANAERHSQEVHPDITQIPSDFLDKYKLSDTKCKKLLNHGIIKSASQNYFCVPCQCTIPTLNHIEAHTTGKRHQKYIKNSTDSKESTNIQQNLNDDKSSKKNNVSVSIETPSELINKSKLSMKIQLTCENETVKDLTNDFMTNKTLVNHYVPYTQKSEKYKIGNIYKRFLMQRITRYNGQWYCYLCKSILQSLANAEHHSHEAHTDINQTLDFPNKFLDLLDTKCEELLNHGIIKGIPQDYFCVPCQCLIPTFDHIDQHITGKKHQTRININTVPENSPNDQQISSDNKNSERNKASLNVEISKLPNKSKLSTKTQPIYKNESTKNRSNGSMANETIVNNYVFYPQKFEMYKCFLMQRITRYNGQWYCYLCDSMLQSLANAKRHSQEAHSDISNETSDFLDKYGELSDMKCKELLNHGIIIKGVPEGYFCVSCQCLIPPVAHIDGHITGKRHQKCIKANTDFKESTNDQQNLNDKKNSKENYVSVETFPELKNTSKISTKIQSIQPICENKLLKDHSNSFIANETIVNDYMSHTQKIEIYKRFLMQRITRYNGQWYCYLCDSMLQSLANAERHSQEAHPDISNETSGFLDKYGELSDMKCKELLNHGIIIKSVPEGYFCVSCQCLIPSVAHIDGHITGKRHQKCIKANTDFKESTNDQQNLNDKKNSKENYVSVETFPELKNTSKISTKIQPIYENKLVTYHANSFTANEIIVNDYMSHTQKIEIYKRFLMQRITRYNGQWYCYLCDSMLQSLANAERHSQEAHSDISNETSGFLDKYGELSDMKCKELLNHGIIIKSIPEGYFCVSCQCLIPPVAHIDGHITGKRHQKCINANTDFKESTNDQQNLNDKKNSKENYVSVETFPELKNTSKISTTIQPIYENKLVTYHANSFTANEIIVNDYMSHTQKIEIYKRFLMQRITRYNGQWYCYLCDSMLQSLANAKRHSQEAHSDISNETSDFLDKYGELSDMKCKELLNHGIIIKSVPEGYFCVSCQCLIPPVAHIDGHITGKRHQKCINANTDFKESTNDQQNLNDKNNSRKNYVSVETFPELKNTSKISTKIQPIYENKLVTYHANSFTANETIVNDYMSHTQKIEIYKRFLMQHVTCYNGQWYCYLCDSMLQSLANADRHSQEAHPDISNETSDFLDKYVELSDTKCKELLNHGITIKSVPHDYFCVPCQCLIPTLDNVKVHITGKKHQKCIKTNIISEDSINDQQNLNDKLKTSKKDNVSVSVKTLPEIINKLKLSVKIQPICENELIKDCSSGFTANETVVNDYVPHKFEIYKRFLVQRITRYNGQWYCYLCKSMLQSLANAEHHSQEVHPDISIQTSDFLDISDELSDMKWKDLLNNGIIKSLPQNYFCVLCKCFIFTIDQIDEHIGKKHQKRVKINTVPENSTNDQQISNDKKNSSKHNVSVETFPELTNTSKISTKIQPIYENKLVTYHANSFTANETIVNYYMPNTQKIEMYKRFLVQRITRYNRQWYCYLCDSMLQSLANADRHSQEAHPDINPQVSDFLDKSIELSVTKCKKLLNHGIIIKGVPQNYFCVSCECSLFTLNQINEHFKGKKHQKRIKINIVSENSTNDQQISNDKKNNSKNNVSIETFPELTNTSKISTKIQPICENKLVKDYAHSFTAYETIAANEANTDQKESINNQQNSNDEKTRKNNVFVNVETFPELTNVSKISTKIQTICENESIKDRSNSFTTNETIVNNYVPHTQKFEMYKRFLVQRITRYNGQWYCYLCDSILQNLANVERHLEAHPDMSTQISDFLNESVKLSDAKCKQLLSHGIIKGVLQDYYCVPCQCSVPTLDHIDEHTTGKKHQKCIKTSTISENSAHEQQNSNGKNGKENNISVSLDTLSDDSILQSLANTERHSLKAHLDINIPKSDFLNESVKLSNMECEELLNHVIVKDVLQDYFCVLCQCLIPTLDHINEHITGKGHTKCIMSSTIPEESINDQTQQNSNDNRSSKKNNISVSVETLPELINNIKVSTKIQPISENDSIKDLSNGFTANETIVNDYVSYPQKFETYKCFLMQRITRYNGQWYCYLCKSMLQSLANAERHSQEAHPDMSTQTSDFLDKSIKLSKCKELLSHGIIKCVPQDYFSSFCQCSISTLNHVDERNTGKEHQKCLKSNTILDFSTNNEQNSSDNKNRKRNNVSVIIGIPIKYANDPKFLMKVQMIYENNLIEDLSDDPKAEKKNILSFNSCKNDTNNYNIPIERCTNMVFCSLCDKFIAKTYVESHLLDKKHISFISALKIFYHQTKHCKCIINFEEKRKIIKPLELINRKLDGTMWPNYNIEIIANTCAHCNKIIKNNDIINHEITVHMDSETSRNVYDYSYINGNITLSCYYIMFKCSFCNEMIRGILLLRIHLFKCQHKKNITLLAKIQKENYNVRKNVQNYFEPFEFLSLILFENNKETVKIMEQPVIYIKNHRTSFYKNLDNSVQQKFTYICIACKCTFHEIQMIIDHLSKEKTHLKQFQNIIFTYDYIYNASILKEFNINETQAVKSLVCTKDISINTLEEHNINETEVNTVQNQISNLITTASTSSKDNTYQSKENNSGLFMSPDIFRENNKLIKKLRTGKHVIFPQIKQNINSISILDRYNRIYQKEYLDFEEIMFSCNQKKLREIKLNLQFYIPYFNAKRMLCLVCNVMHSYDIHSLYEHTHCEQHITQFTQLQKRNENFKLNLLKELIKIESMDVKCYACKPNIKLVYHNKSELIDHIHISSHKKNRTELLKEAKYILEEFKTLWYNIKYFACVVCNARFEMKIEFLQHLNKKHKAVLSTRDNSKFDFCITCSTLWYEQENLITSSYQLHCQRQMHQYLAKGNNFAIKSLPQSLQKLLKNIDKTIADLLKLSNDILNDSKSIQLKNALKHTFETYPFPVEVCMFGSRVTGLALLNSDIDIYLNFGDEYTKDTLIKSRSKQIERYLNSDPENWKIKSILDKSRTPIIKVKHRLTGLECDISFMNGLALENSKLIKSFIKAYPPCRKLILFLKRWLSLGNLTGFNKISSYALAWLVIFYLQVKYKNQVPSVTTLIKNHNQSKIISGWETGVGDTININIPELPIHQLLLGFFKYYGGFDYMHCVVCPLLGITCRKELFTEISVTKISVLPNSMTPYTTQLRTGKPEYFRVDSPMCIQDPFELSHNLTKAVSILTLKCFKQYCKESASTLCDITATSTKKNV